MNEDLIAEVVENIKEQANNLKQIVDKNEVEHGILIGLAEALSIIRDAYSGYDLKKIGLDFDIDKEYL